ncbi:response regulator transcription factor [Parasedimentitalea maritima]|uniref:Response regulator transcription factor n=1 Tax=Parasedimentitalea maritima TaxID=2578117 RepID=A0ABY2UNC6_9RHOB|nr:response regulator transcription factor [Zongyanglinia marina]TLP55313.1 response regulator transcription factor [Zongyanglinia marina]
MTKNKKLIRVVVADSHDIIRTGIASCLEEQCPVTIVGQTSSGFDTLNTCRREDPDLLIMDLSLTRPTGMETFEKLREKNRDLKILLMSSDADPASAFHVLAKGAVGLMPKQATCGHFAHVVGSIIQGYSCIPLEYLSQIVDLQQRAHRTGNLFGLSRREIEVLEACSDGAKSKEIAQRLSISVRTVESHRNSIYRKSGHRCLETLAQTLDYPPCVAE